MGAKTKGYIQEVKVVIKLLEMGFVVSQISGDDHPYDLICDWNGKLSRVQIKSTNQPDHTGYRYHVLTSKGNKQKSNYTKEDCDFIIALLTDINIFYIIPIEKIGVKSINLYPTGRRQKQKHERDLGQFLNAWDLLK
jgi:hypothetical protein